MTAPRCNRKYLLLALLPLCAFTPGFAQDQPPAKEPIAVMDLKAEGVPQSTANVLSNKLRTELFNSGKYNVLNREDMKAILGEQEFQQSGICDDMKCMAKIGGALGVVYMVTGSIGKLGETYNITLKMIDIEKIVNVNIIDEPYSGREDGLFIAIQNAGRKLMGRTDLLEYKQAETTKKNTVVAAPAPVNEGLNNYNRFAISRTATGLRQNGAVFSRGYFAGNLAPRVKECPEAMRFISLGKSQRGAGLPLGLVMIAGGAFFYVKCILQLVNDEGITKQASAYFGAAVGVGIPGGFMMTLGGANFDKAVGAFNNCMKQKYLSPPAPANTRQTGGDAIPGPVKELYDKAVACIKNGQFKEAVDYSTKAIVANPAYTKAYKSRGFAYMQLKFYPQAVYDLNKYLKIDNNSDNDFDQVRASIKAMGYVPDK
jgi:TolB-like protein